MPGSKKPEKSAAPAKKATKPAAKVSSKGSAPATKKLSFPDVTPKSNDCVILTKKYAPSQYESNRLGGLPLGVDAETWPLYNGLPMCHVLTLDLQERPGEYRKGGPRAVSLFLSSPNKHEAYQPGNAHAKVVFLTIEDLQKGLPEWPQNLPDENELGFFGIKFSAGEGLTEKQRLQKSFMAPSPLWLQGDGEDSRHSPGSFILQFGGDLIDINLGDGGVMYMHSNTAWLQRY